MPKLAHRTTIPRPEHPAWTRYFAEGRPLLMRMKREFSYDRRPMMTLRAWEIHRGWFRQAKRQQLYIEAEADW